MVKVHHLLLKDGIHADLVCSNSESASSITNTKIECKERMNYLNIFFSYFNVKIKH